MFTNIFTCSRFLNPLLSDICKKSTDEYIRRIIKQKEKERCNEEFNKLNINPEIFSSLVLNKNKNNYPPNSFFNFLSIFSFISVTYFYILFYTNSHSIYCRRRQK
jgi:hypothetical protein